MTHAERLILSVAHTCPALEKMEHDGLVRLMPDLASETGWSLVLPDIEAWESFVYGDIPYDALYPSLCASEYANTVYNIAYCPFCGVSLPYDHIETWRKVTQETHHQK